MAAGEGRIFRQVLRRAAEMFGVIARLIEIIGPDDGGDAGFGLERPRIAIRVRARAAGRAAIGLAKNIGDAAGLFQDIGGCGGNRVAPLVVELARKNFAALESDPVVSLV